MLSFRHSAARVTFRAFSTTAGPQSSSLVRDLVDSPKDKPDYSLPMKFGSTFSDHMFEVDWTREAGWGTPTVSPYHDLALNPAATSLQYSLQCFEGMKAYIDPENRARLFRPQLNMQRFNRSMARLAMPTFDESQMLACIKQFVSVEKAWIPNIDGYSLYLRPTGISTHPFLGVGPTDFAKVYCIASPVGPYYPEGFSAVSLLADTENVRAWPGGTGASKVGGNYAPGILPQIDAMGKGYSQVLWLFGADHTITEVGTMNMFVLLKQPDGEVELVTPPLDDGTILPGVTRQSILDLARAWGEVRVSERAMTMAEFTEAANEGRVVESFGAGTAAIVAPIKRVGYAGVDYDIPLDPSQPAEQAGPFTRRLYNAITDIQYGRVEYEDWSVVID